MQVPLIPTEIRVDHSRRRLEIKWSDGTVGYCTFEDLRWNCPCAVCQGEMGQPGLLSRLSELSLEQTELENIWQVGYYAIGLAWKDGHDTGIYPFELLRRLCRPE